MAIRFVEVIQTGRILQVRREIDLPDGTVQEDVHAFPVEAMAYRAGEYGVPVTDTETLLDIITYEALPEFAPDAVAPFVVTEPTLEEGRAAHLARVAELKDRHVARTGNGRSVAAKAATRAADVRVRAEVVAASDLDPELAELAGADMARKLPAARKVYQVMAAHQRALDAVEAAPNGDGTSSTLKEQLRARASLAAGPTMHGRQ